MNLTKYCKLHYLPIIMCLCFISTFVVTCIMSISAGHVYENFPYISEAGSFPPESCIFSQMFNISAVLFCITTYIRYRQVDFAITCHKVENVEKWNSVALYFGIIASFGASVVGNFQVVRIFSIHIVGAIMIFGIGTLYLVIQMIISFKLKEVYYQHPEYGIGWKTIYARAFFTACCVVFICVVLFFGLSAQFQFTGDNIFWWTENDGGFRMHLISVYTEWCLAITFLLCALTATNEFKLLKFVEIRFISSYENSTVSSTKEIRK